MNPYLSLTKPFGTLALVGHVGVLEDKINTFGLVFGNRKLAGSAIGGIKETQELLELCAENKIIATYELIKMQEVPEAWHKLTDGVSDRRFIIDIDQYRKDNGTA